MPGLWPDSEIWGFAQRPFLLTPFLRVPLSLDLWAKHLPSLYLKSHASLSNWYDSTDLNCNCHSGNFVMKKTVHLRDTFNSEQQGEKPHEEILCLACLKDRSLSLTGRPSSFSPDLVSASFLGHGVIELSKSWMTIWTSCIDELSWVGVGTSKWVFLHLSLLSSLEREDNQPLVAVWSQLPLTAFFLSHFFSFLGKLRRLINHK